MTGGPTTLYYQHHPLDVEGWRGDNFAVHVQHRRLQRGDLRQRAPAADRAPVHAGHRRLRDELPAQARRGCARYRAHALVSPQRRLRRDRVLPRRFALRHPDAARADFACAARRSPRRAGEGARTGPPQVRRVRPGRLVGDRHRHPPQARCRPPKFWPTIWGSTDDRTTAEAPVKYEYDRIPYLVAYQNNSGVRDVYGGVAELVVLESYLLKPKTKPSDTVLVFMHPIGGGAYLPMINALARARPSRHLLQQPLPRHRLRAADGEGRRGPRRVHQGRQEPAGLRRRWCWPAGAAAARCRCSTSSRRSTRRSPRARRATGPT